MTDELWKEVQNTNGLYMVSNHGRLARIMTPRSGVYTYAELSPKKLPKIRKLLHRLILETFIGPPPTPSHEGNHKDGVKKNNRLDNLEWVTPSENRYHSYRVLGNKVNQGGNNPHYGKFGSENPTAKKYVVTSPAGESFVVHGLNKFCKENGLDVGTMSNIARGRYGAKSHKGWRCVYAKND